MGNREQFNRHIRGRMNIFLFILLLVLSIVFAHSMCEVAVMVINGLVENAEYPVRVMEACYAPQMLDACVAQNEKTPELLAVDGQMKAFLSQDAIKARGMAVLYTDDGESLKYVTGVGKLEGAFGDDFGKLYDEDANELSVKEYVDKGESFEYFEGFDKFTQLFKEDSTKSRAYLLSADYRTEDGEDNLRIQMIRGEHTYFLCADVGQFAVFEDKGKNMDGELLIDGAIGTLISSIIRLLLLLITRLLIIHIASFVLMFLLVGRTVTSPIRKLDAAARGLAHMTKTEVDPNLWKFTPPAISTGDEIESLAVSFDELVSGLKQATLGLIEESAARERLNTELSLASSIQQNALKSNFPAFPDRDDFDIIASMTPAKEVGGDFYDFFLVDDDHLVFLIADVSSKGVPAALFMMQAMTLLRSGFVYSMDIEKIFTVVNDWLCDGNEESMFVTCWLGLMELSTGELSIVDAGHEPALLVRDGQCSEIPTKGGLVLAAFEGYKYEKNSINLSHGDKIFLFTDGLNEAQNSAQEIFDLERLEASVAKHGKEDIETMRNSVLSDINSFVGDADQFDDQTIVIFEYK